jgi:hypothetical protein
MEPDKAKNPETLAANSILESWYEDVIYSVAEQIDQERRKHFSDMAGDEPFPTEP